MQTGTVARPGASRPERRPLIAQNIPQGMNLLGVALGGAPAKAPRPLKASVRAIKADVAAVFKGLPEALRGSVVPLSKVRCRRVRLLPCVPSGPI